METYDLQNQSMDGSECGESRFCFEDYTQRAIIGSIVSLVSGLGLFGNLLVIIAVLLSRKLQTRTNIFVVNLAIADLVTCLCAPFTVVALLSKDGWPLPEIICSLSAALGYMSICCSILTLAAIAINRFVLITKPMQLFQMLYTPKKIAAMLALTWLYPLLICSLPFLGLGRWGYSRKYKTCAQDTSDEMSDNYSLVGSIMIYPAPLIILFVCYYKIYRHITQHNRRMERHDPSLNLSDTPSQGNSSSSSSQQLSREGSTLPAGVNRRQVEITKNLFLVMCAFLACLSPFAIALTIPPSDPIIPWTGMIIIFNSMLNPVIYGLKHPHFKQVFRCILCCRCHMIPEPTGLIRRMRSR